VTDVVSTHSNVDVMHEIAVFAAPRNLAACGVVVEIEGLYIFVAEDIFKEDQMVQRFAHILTTGKHLMAMF
jgi:hypothetical protein